MLRPGRTKAIGMSNTNEIPTPGGAAAEPKPAFIAPGHSFATVTDKISSIVLTQKFSRGWLVGLAVSATLAV